VIAEAGHFAQREQPGIVSRAIVAFLGEIGSR
jgi:pimeloyl-ACP methyl ester carboxylesterase